MLNFILGMLTALLGLVVLFCILFPALAAYIFLILMGATVT